MENSTLVEQQLHINKPSPPPFQEVDLELYLELQMKPNLYRINENGAPVLYSTEDMAVSNERKDEQRHPKLFIKAEAKPAYAQAAVTHFLAELNEGLSNKDHNKVAQTVVKWVEFSFNEIKLINNNEAASSINTLVGEVINFSEEDAEGILNIVKELDYSTAQHSMMLLLLSLKHIRVLIPSIEDNKNGNEFRRVIGIGALHHDTGKLSINKDVLLKKEKLSDEEWVQMKQHPQSGADIIESMDFEKLGISNPSKIIIKNIALLHHVRADGGGYPRVDLSNPVFQSSRRPALFIRMLDIFEAVTSSNRPYREGENKSIDNAKNILMEDAKGDGLDKQMVDAFISSLH